MGKSGTGAYLWRNILSLTDCLLPEGTLSCLLPGCSTSPQPETELGKASLRSSGVLLHRAGQPLTHNLRNNFGGLSSALGSHLLSGREEKELQERTRYPNGPHQTPPSLSMRAYCSLRWPASHPLPSQPILSSLTEGSAHRRKL